MHVDKLVAILRPERTDRSNVFVGHPSPEERRSTYGWLFVAQALLAAANTAGEDRIAHSLHGSFLRAGIADQPTEYAVEVVRDGRGYSHREVRASQGDRECFRAIVSFQVPQPAAADYWGAPPPAPSTVDPADLPSYVDWVRDGTDNPDHFWLTEPGPVDIRLEAAPPPQFGRPVTEPLRVWLRLRGEIPSADPLLHAALIGWLSDKTLSDGISLVHGHRWTDHGTDSVSLDHALFLLRPARADQWFCCTQQALSTSSGRGLASGSFTTIGGALIAHAVQEAVLQLDH